MLFLLAGILSGPGVANVVALQPIVLHSSTDVPIARWFEGLCEREPS